MISIRSKALVIPSQSSGLTQSTSTNGMVTLTCVAIRACKLVASKTSETDLYYVGTFLTSNFLSYSPMKDGSVLRNSALLPIDFSEPQSTYLDSISMLS